MPDVYATIADADAATLEQIAEVLEIRASEPAQREMLEDYTSRLRLADGSRALEVGCGTGAVCRHLATLPGVAEVTGVDPSPLLIERASELSPAELRFLVGDGRELGLEDGSFDLVVFHTTLCHVPDPERAIAEAHRVLAPGGTLAVFDGDYTTTTVAIGAEDPLQACVDASVENLVHDPWLLRRIEPLLDAAGFADVAVRGHSYVQIREADYMLTLVRRGADMLAADGRIGEDAAEALKREADRRLEAGTFFGHIAYLSAVAARQ